MITFDLGFALFHIDGQVQVAEQARRDAIVKEKERVELQRKKDECDRLERQKLHYLQSDPVRLGR